LLKQDKNYSNLKLLLVGDGEEKKNYIKLANKLGIVNDINFTGFISNEQLHPQYQKMDIVVIPSIRESFGISVLEGMSCEIPLIASDISGFNEVGNIETITFFKPENEIDLADKIKACITDYKAYKAKAVKARERVVTLFSEKACLDKKVNLYKQLLDK
jgi:L-malate glycosyltransferase